MSGGVYNTYFAMICINLSKATGCLMFHIIYLRSVLRCRASPVMLAACRQSSSHGGCAGFNRSTPDFGWRMIMDFWILGTNAFWVQVKVLQMSFGAGLYFYPYSVLQSLGNPFFFVFWGCHNQLNSDLWIIVRHIRRAGQVLWISLATGDLLKKCILHPRTIAAQNEQNKRTWEEKSWL